MNVTGACPLSDRENQCETRTCHQRSDFRISEGNSIRSKHLRQKNILLGFSDRGLAESPRLASHLELLTCKHPAYERENEVRLIILGSQNPLTERCRSAFAKVNLFRISIADGAHKPGCIVEVVIGLLLR